MRPLTEDEPSERRDEYDLRVAQNGCEPGSHEQDRVVPEKEIRGEEDAGDPRPAPLAHVAAPPAPLLPPHERKERRQRKQAAEERAGPGSCARGGTGFRRTQARALR